jgi:hypothetical protein
MNPGTSGPLAVLEFRISLVVACRQPEIAESFWLIFLPRKSKVVPMSRSNFFPLLDWLLLGVANINGTYCLVLANADDSAELVEILPRARFKAPCWIESVNLPAKFPCMLTRDWTTKTDFAFDKTPAGCPVESFNVMFHTNQGPLSFAMKASSDELSGGDIYLGKIRTLSAEEVARLEFLAA